MTDEGDLLNRYVDEVLAATRKRPALTKEELRDVALGIGLTESDLEVVAERARQHKVRGEGFLLRGCHDEAVAELEAASHLEPLDTTRRYDLARALAARWKATRRAKDRDEAMRYARLCTEHDPAFGPAYDLLKTLSQPARPRESSRRVLYLVLACAVMLVGAALVVVMAPRDRPAAPIKIEKPAIPPRASMSATTEATERVIPVELVRPDGEEDLVLTVQRSVAHTYRTGFAYELRALLAGQRDELLALKLRLDGVARDGTVLASRFIDVVDNERSYVGPGDTALVAGNLYAGDAVVRLVDVATARIEVVLSDRQPADGAVPAGKPLPLAWDTVGAGRPSLEITERSATLSQAGSKGYHFVTLVVHNTGRRPIRTLRVVIRWLGPGDEELDSKSIYLLSDASTAALPAGHRAPFLVIGELAGAALLAGYTVTVVEAE